jgi:nucleoside-diphosphate-sugar epimerase
MNIIKMKIVVTGATGGLGRSLTEYLLGKGVEVVALGRNEKIGLELSGLGAIFLAGDITDTDYLANSFAGADLIIHSAGVAAPWGIWEQFYQANVLGTKAVLEAMLKTKISRLIYLSTPSVYFSGKPILKVREDSTLPSPQTFYARSKIMADELVMNAVNSRGISAVLLRPRSIIGKHDTAILPRILRMMEKGIFPLPNGGEAVVDLTSVENVIQVIWLCINSKQYFRGEIFNITNDEPMKVSDLTRLIADTFNYKVKFIPVPLKLLLVVADLSEFYALKISHREPKLTRYALQSLGVTQTLSIEKAQNHLGYKPTISLKESFENLI